MLVVTKLSAFFSFIVNRHASDQSGSWMATQHRLIYAINSAAKPTH
jgi:hypothetical protein